MNCARLAYLFDFDGVIADSEVISNRELARALSAIGLPTSFEDCLTLYYGRNWIACEQQITALYGAPLPEGFVDGLKVASAAALAEDLQPVSGAQAFVARRAAMPKAIASSSEREYLVDCLNRFGMGDHFGTHLCSAAALKRGKPFPDIYLAAAAGLGMTPASCLVIEDSPVGVQAGVTAGMTVVGLLAGSHVVDHQQHGQRLRDAGAHFVAAGYDEIENWLEVA